MDCAVCNVRSSVGYCAECHTLLCEECGSLCDECSKRICPVHVNETRHGRSLCLACFQEYSERRHIRELEADGVEVEHHAPQKRLERSGEAIRPWLASLYLAVLGLVGVGLLLIFPSLRVIELSQGGGFATAYVVVIIPSLSIAWALLGLFTRWSRDPKSLNFIGLALACLTIGLAFFAVRPLEERNAVAPRTSSEADEAKRANLNKEELEGWRTKMLDRYEGENAPEAPAGRGFTLDQVAPPPAGR